MQIHIVNRNDLRLHIVYTHTQLDVIVGDFEDYNFVVVNTVFVRILVVPHNHKIVFDLVANYYYNVAEVEVDVVLVEAFGYKEDDYLLVGRKVVGHTQNCYIQDYCLCLFLCNYFGLYPLKIVDHHFWVYSDNFDHYYPIVVYSNPCSYFGYYLYYNLFLYLVVDNYRPLYYYNYPA